jgi:hypothetical protein
MADKKTGQICPKCGCHIGEAPYKKGDVLYCCRACAEGGRCTCGGCDEIEIPPTEE